VIHRGLTRSYNESEASLASLRGRVLVSRQVRRVVHDRIECRYSELSLDTAENLVLKASLYYLRDRRPREIPVLLSRMREVSLRPIPRAAWPRIRYGQLNKHYRKSLNLARLAIKGPARYILLERKPRQEETVRVDPYPDTGEFGESYDVQARCSEQYRDRGLDAGP